MKLSDCNKGQIALIKKIESNEELKQRFYSFGIIQGVKVIIGEISLAKNTLTIDVNGTQIALRVEEAKQISVELV